MSDEREDPSGTDTGIPAGPNGLDAHADLTGRIDRHHWRQSTIVTPGLEGRDDVFFAALQMTRMPMILTDPRQPDNPIAFANNAFLDLTGYEESEIIGRNCRFLQGAETDRGTVDELREAVRTRQAIAIEILNYRRDGSPFWNAVFIGPVFDAEGELLYFFASQLDVTRRRESEQLFRQAQKMESIGQLTAGLAHDFNNLLHVVTNSLERLGARRDDDQAFARYLATATAAAERGSKLTRQLLAFARRSRLEPKGVDATALISSIAELLDSSAGSKVDLQLNLRRRLPEIMVDPIHLEMALLNVVINARDALTEGGEIVIATRPLHLNGDAPAHELPSGDYVVVSVTDTGTGMTPEVLARATEPFFTTKGMGEGSGLGLAMAQGFVQQSGGRLEIESEPGKGTTVSMLFPVNKRPVEPAVGVLSQFKAEAVDHGAPPLVLVVEDNPDIAAMAEETLTETGYRVLVAHSAEEGLDLFERASEVDGGVSLVFSDVVMPGGMNGVLFAQELRRRAPELPILMTTGYNDQMALEGPQPVAMDVIGKPYRRSELVSRVQAALRKGAVGEPRQKSDFGTAEA